MSTVLAFSCPHCPAMRKGFVSFLKKVKKKYKANRIVCCGDLVDYHAISFHEKDPEMPSIADEFKLAQKQVKQIHDAFPEADYVMGNHCSLPQRQARTVGLLDDMLKPFGELWGLDGWTIHPRFSKFYIDGVQYRHGDSGKGGAFAAGANAMAEFCSVVQGDKHSQAGVQYHANDGNLVFGMQVGVGVQPDHPAMNYSRKFAARSIVGCGVVIDGKTAIFEPMAM